MYTRYVNIHVDEYNLYSKEEKRNGLIFQMNVKNTIVDGYDIIFIYIYIYTYISSMLA